MLHINHPALRRIGLACAILSTTTMLGACAPPAQSAPAHAADESARTITVVGRGEVHAKPDVARTTLGVEVTAPTLSEATTVASARMSEVTAALKKLGVADKDIQTSNLSVSLERAPDGPIPPLAAPRGAMPRDAMPGPPAPPRHDLYRVSNTVAVTIRDLGRVGPTIEAALAAGANSLWGLSFGLDKTEAIEAEARRIALADARSRAEALAKLSGVALGRVVAISEIVESGGQVPIPMAAAVREGGAGTPVSPGEVAYEMQVKVIYAL